MLLFMKADRGLLVFVLLMLVGAKLSAQNGQFEIPINGLTQGLYTIVLISEKSVYTDKIVVQ